MTDSYIYEHVLQRFKDVIDEFNMEHGYSCVVFEPNDTGNRPQDELWFEIFELHGSPSQQELGSTGRNRWTFGLQININGSRASITGTSAYDEAYDYIAAHFKRGDIFDGIRVLQTAYRSSARIQDDYYSVPVTIMVQADLEN